MPTTTGAQLIAAMLKGYGVTHLFMVPSIIREGLAELDKLGGVVPVQTHSEGAAGYMADGYARALRRPGVCLAQHVGSLNLAAGLRDAWLARSPVVAITGGREHSNAFRNAYQDVEDLAAFGPVTKLNATIDSADRIPDMFRRAFRTAVSGNPGPVHLRLRGNEGQIESEETTIEPLCEERFRQVPPFRPEPSDADVQSILAALRSASRPIIVAGGGVRFSDASDELLAVAERFQLPVATSLNGKGCFPGNHPLSVGVVGTYSRDCANRLVGEADLICFVGSSTGGMTTHFWRVPGSGSAVVQIDIDPESIGRNYSPKAAALGDAKATLAKMLTLGRADHGPSRLAWLQRASRMSKDWRSRHAAHLESDAAPIRPERVCSDLSKYLPDDAVVLADTGHSGMWMGGMFDIRSPRQSYLRSAGHLGWSFPAAVGAKCACPDRPVVVFTGDSAFWYHLAEIETAVRMRVNLVTVVNNNSSGNQSKPGFDKAWGGKQSENAERLWKFERVSFARMAVEMGAVGMRVEKARDFAPALEKALSAGKPVVIDVVTDIDAFAPLAVVD